MAQTIAANDRVNNAPLWHVYAAGAPSTNQDLGAYAAAHGQPNKAAVAFQALGTGTVVVKRQCDDGTETVVVVADRVVRGQCSTLVSSDVAVIFYWA